MCSCKTVITGLTADNDEEILEMLRILEQGLKIRNRNRLIAHHYRFILLLKKRSQHTENYI